MNALILAASKIAGAAARATLGGVCSALLAHPLDAKFSGLTGISALSTVFGIKIRVNACTATKRLTFGAGALSLITDLVGGTGGLTVSAVAGIRLHIDTLPIADPLPFGADQLALPLDAALTGLTSISTSTTVAEMGLEIETSTLTGLQLAGTLACTIDTALTALTSISTSAAVSDIGLGINADTGAEELILRATDLTLAFHT